MFNNLAGENREISSIERLDELSLYLEICKCKRNLENMENIFSNKGIDNVTLQYEKVKLNNRLALLLSSLFRFGIDSTSDENITDWMRDWESYLAKLNDDEYKAFAFYRSTCQSLEFFVAKKNEVVKSLQKEDFLVKQIG